MIVKNKQPKRKDCFLIANFSINGVYRGMLEHDEQHVNIYKCSIPKQAR